MQIRDVQSMGRHAIVASEPTTYKNMEWTLIGKKWAVVVSAGTLKLKGLHMLERGLKMPKCLTWTGIGYERIGYYKNGVDKRKHISIVA
jgi:hypothetical protein